MSDRELLEMAAKAAGLKIYASAQAERDAIVDPEKASLWLANGTTGWNPLTDDGDALRLAVKLLLSVDHKEESVVVWDGCIGTGFIQNGDDPSAATRRAIVRAAAEIGKATP